LKDVKDGALLAWNLIQGKRLPAFLGAVLHKLSMQVSALKGCFSRHNYE
jgi:hypothetical protein